MNHRLYIQHFFYFILFAFVSLLFLVCLYRVVLQQNCGNDNSPTFSRSSECDRSNELVNAAAVGGTHNVIITPNPAYATSSSIMMTENPAYL